MCEITVGHCVSVALVGTANPPHLLRRMAVWGESDGMINQQRIGIFTSSLSGDSR